MYIYNVYIYIYKRIQLSFNSIIVQLYEYNIVSYRNYLPCGISYTV